VFPIINWITFHQIQSYQQNNATPATFIHLFCE
jgi:hypothetical protein